MVIAGWVAALPISAGLGIATYLNFRYGVSRATLWNVAITAVMLAYYLAISACEVGPTEAPANVVPLVSGNFVAV